MNFSKLCSLLILIPWLSIASVAEPHSDQTEREIMAVLDRFMETFNASEPQAHTETYHFPHFRLAKGDMHSLETREDAIRAYTSLFKNLPKTGWFRSEWIDRKIISISDAKIHVATRFRRLREDGSEIVTAESLYILIKIEGRWGIKLRSSYL